MKSQTKLSYQTSLVSDKFWAVQKANQPLLFNVEHDILGFLKCIFWG